MRGAYLNVRINSSDLEDQEISAKLLARAQEIDAEAESLEAEILAVVEEKL